MPEVEGMPDGGVRLGLEAQEADLLRRLTEQLRDLLGGRGEDDPVLDRLFPDAFEDPEDAQSFRDLTGDDLEREKLRALETVSDVLGRRGRVDATIPREDVDTWLTALTDLRLALGTRLEVDEESMAAEPDPADPRAGALAALHWLGWVQESILREVAGE